MAPYLAYIFEHLLDFLYAIYCDLCVVSDGDGGAGDDNTVFEITTTAKNRAPFICVLSMLV